MEIVVPIQLNKIRITVTPATRRISDIIGFAVIEIIDAEENIIFIARGYTIRVKTFNDTPTFTVNAPAYKSGFKYRTSFIVESKALWSDVQKVILEDFANQTGGLHPEDYITEEINPDDIKL
jgi:hypothetical protein